MDQLGIRELKNTLSKQIARVKEGHIVVVTDHGRPVAHLIPAGLPEEVERLMIKGRVTWFGGKCTPPKSPPAPRPGKLLSSYISEERR